MEKITWAHKQYNLLRFKILITELFKWAILVLGIWTITWECAWMWLPPSGIKHDEWYSISTSLIILIIIIFLFIKGTKWQKYWRRKKALYYSVLQKEAEFKK